MATYLLRAEITRPRVDRLLLIMAPSFNRSPLVPETSARSDPARSIMHILDV